MIRTDDERTHHYHYDSQHRLVFYTRIQHEEPLVESRYLCDPLGRRTGKRVWRRESDLTGWMSLSRKPEVTWYGWDGDWLTTVQTDTTRIQTVYQPGSFTPLIRIETENGEREKMQRRSLAEKLQSEGSEDGHGVVFPAELVRMLDRLEEEIRAGRVSSESRAWLAQCGLTVEQLARQVEPEYTPARKVHLYHCDHRGLPLALISEDGNTAWRGEYDEWGNQLNEENPHHVYQPYRLPGQQYDEESGLYYNRNRYYDPLQGRYITQDPIGPVGGGNPYSYVLNNPAQFIDPTGLTQEDNWTYGEVGNSCVTSQRDFTPPPGLADMKASIGAACSRNNASRNCHPVDGSNASAPSDKAAWENIQNATNGKDLSGGGNMFCVGNEDCAVVHSCREIVNARHPAGRVRERVTPLTTSGTATLNGTTVYFYNDPRNGNCPAHEYIPQ
ncbi:RHS repeat-associated core domain protein [Escherichia coli 2845650]|nr:RHS repeat-associated core domain protein [Escherichia coli 2845650]